MSKKEQKQIDDFRRPRAYYGREQESEVTAGERWKFGIWSLALYGASMPLAAQQHYLSLDVENGSRLYRNNCFACHGPEGASIPGVDFRRGVFKRVSSDEDLLRVIANGVPGTAMPPTAMNDSGRLALVAYIRSLSESATGS